jgi:mitochondrial fission protein ELM1
MWDGTGPNPYPALLSAADAIIVTADSASMTAEAISTGTPVYVHPLQGGNEKFQYFQQQLVASGHTRPCTVPLPPYTPVPLDESQVVAKELITRLPGCAGPHLPPV